MLNIAKRLNYVIRKAFSSILIIISKTIMRKLISVFLIFIILPIMLSSIFSYIFLQKTVRDKINLGSEMAMLQTEINIERNIDDIISVSSILMMDKEVSSVLYGVDNGSTLTQLDKIYIVSKKIFELQATSSDVNLTNIITLIDRNGFMYSNLPQFLSDERDRIRDILKEEEQYLDDFFVRWAQRIHYINFSGFNMHRGNYIVMLRRYVDFSNWNNKGDIVFAIPEYKFSKILKSLVTTTGIKAYIVNDSGYVLSSTEPGDLGKTLQYLQNLPDDSLETVKTTELKGAEKGILNYKVLNRVNWRIVQVIPNDSLFMEIIKMRRFIILVSFIFIVLFIGISYFFAESISKPLSKLDKASKEIAAGNLEARVNITSQDEVARLADNFNTMAEEIKQLIWTNTETEKKKNKMQIQMLYAQINPHFLFNTLNSIRWMAEASKIYDVSKSIVALSNLLKTTIIQKNDFITIKEEIDNVKNYILIHKFRYLSLIEEKYDIPEELLKNKILKFILQPIVENSIIHGFNGIKYKGVIGIKVFKDGNKIRLTVSDNGLGMSAELIQNIMNNSDEKFRRFTGIGVSNVNDRIILHFGNEYGLKIKSTPLEGTTVDIIIPLLGEEIKNAEDIGS